MFQVWTDGVKKYDSGVMTATTATASVNVNLAGAVELALIITDGGQRERGGPRRLGERAGDLRRRHDGADGADGRARSAGATGVAVTANVTGTFSEAMNAATLTTTTVTLVPQGSTTPVAATVTLRRRRPRS